MNSATARILAPLLLVLALGGCSQADLIQKFTSPAEQSLATGYIDQLRQKRLAGIEKAADPSIANPSLHDTLLQMAAMFPSGEPTSLTLVGAHRNYTGDVSTVNLTFEYGFSGRWLLTNVAMKKVGELTTIVGLQVVPQTASLEEQNRFSLDGKTLLQHAVLALTIAVLLLTLYAFVLCIKTKFSGRKWPWVLFVLLGVGKFAMNWTTGQWGFMPLSIQLFSASAMAAPYQPWILAISFPLGAIVFLIRRKRLIMIPRNEGVP